MFLGTDLRRDFPTPSHFAQEIAALLHATTTTKVEIGFPATGDWPRSRIFYVVEFLRTVGKDAALAALSRTTIPFQLLIDVPYSSG